MEPQQQPFSCDTMVALPSVTANGQVIFGKNSDRPQEEAQPLVLQPHKVHDSGEADTQFVSVPQARETYRHVGSRPYWCSGYEHGFNEHQVVIGNEALPTRLPVALTAIDHSRSHLVQPAPSYSVRWPDCKC